MDLHDTENKIQKIQIMNKFLLHVDTLISRYGGWLPDALFLRTRFFVRMGYKLNLDNPKTYSEKIQWLKLYDRRKIYTTLVDKYEVKIHVRDLIGEEHLAKTYGVWDSPNEIDFSKLPERFVLKTTHGGGNEGVIVVNNKKDIDVDNIKFRLSKALKQDLYKHSREWPYKNIKKRIIAEEFLEDKETGELRDYKFFCFNGEVKALFVATERQKRAEPFFNFFDSDYNKLDLMQGHPKSSVLPAKPSKFDEMKALAEKLSKGLPHVRIDFYQANGIVYFGEFTFYHFGGMVPFEPNKWDEIFGTWLTLPEKTNTKD